jgi:DNA-binding beta-propeller fold protein YncE
VSAGASADAVAIAERAVATLSVPGYVDFLAADGRGVWATNTDRVERFELGSSTPVAVVTVPGACGAMVVAYDSLWVAGCKDQSVYRVDLRSRTVVDSIQTGLADADGELSLAAGGGSIWVLSDAKGTLTRIDVATNAIVARIEVLPRSFCAAFGFGAVWVTNSASDGQGSVGSVQRIDPLTNMVAATIATGPDPRFLAAGEGAVWTFNWADGSVTRIDPRDHATTLVPLRMLGGGGDIATGAGRVWVRGADTLLLTVDPLTYQVDEVFGPPEGSGAVRVAEDLVWVTAHDTKTVWVLETARRA